MQMKIVYIFDSLANMAGTERVIVDKANFFAEKLGYNVYIITTDQNTHPVVYSLYKTIKHIDLGINFYQRYKFNRLKREITYWKLRRKFKNKITNTLISLHPDITICTTIYPIDFLPSISDGSIKIIEAHLAKEYSGNQYLYTKKNLFFKIIARFLSWKTEHFVKKFDELVVLTQKDANSWAKTKEATIIPNSLPFYPKEKSTCKNKQIISAGRLDDQKGYDLLIQAWKIVAEKHSEWSLHIYGNGSLKNALKETIEKEGLSDSLIIKKPVSDIYNKYIESSIYVMSSRYEGFGMVLIEAMACGVPVVSFDCPNGPSDIVTNGEDGFLVKNGDIEALAEKMCYLIENENKRIEMGEKARENVKRYMPDIIMEKWIDLFNSLK